LLLIGDELHLEVTVFANFGPGHWAVLAVAMMVLFGAKKLPDAARSLGSSLRVFKSEVRELHNDVSVEERDNPPTPVPSQRVDRRVPGQTPTDAPVG
jgi:sec-independent protein translocase protein TatA